MDVNDLFPSLFLKARDLAGRARIVVITEVVREDIGTGEIKPVMRFSGLDKALVLNKTNAMVLASTFGSETENWKGKRIELYPEKVQFQGRIVDAIRVRVPVPPAASEAVPASPPAEELNDDIPQWD